MDRQCLCSSHMVQLNTKMAGITSVKKNKTKTAVALLEGIGEPSSDHKGK